MNVRAASETAEFHWLGSGILLLLLPCVQAVLNGVAILTFFVAAASESTSHVLWQSRSLHSLEVNRYQKM